MIEDTDDKEMKMKYSIFLDPNDLEYFYARNLGENFQTEEEARHRVYILNELNKDKTMQKEDDLFQSVFEKHGETNQLFVAMEECAELIKEISKYHRSGVIPANMAEEIADVQIMCRQLIYRFGLLEKVKEETQRKMNRLKIYLNS